MKTKAACGYVRLRSVLPGFVVEVSRPTWDSLEAQGYTSLLQDRGHFFILFGPLSLVMDGKDDVWFGTVQYRFDWGTCEGSTSHPSTDQNEITRLVRLGTLPRPGESGRMPRQSFRAGEEILVRYSEGSSQRGGGTPNPPTLLPTDTGNSRGRPTSELTPQTLLQGSP